MSNSKSVYPICFWCGKVFPTPMVLGDEVTQEQKDTLPEQCILHYDPCPDCMNEWTRGRVFIEYDEQKTYPVQPSLDRPDGFKFYPTGRIYVIPVEKALALFGKDGDAEPISFLSKENFKMVFETDPEISCFWCGNPFDGSQRTVKRLKAVKSYEPCNACKTKWSEECILFECDYTSDRAIDSLIVICDGEPMHPTGRLMRLDPKEAKRLMGDVGNIVYISASKFRILSGEDKLNSKRNTVASQNTPRRKSSVLARNDDN